MNKFKIISLSMRLACIIYFLLISFWAIFSETLWWQALSWWATNLIVIVILALISVNIWDMK